MADWGDRIRRRSRDRGIETKDVTTNKNGRLGKDNGYSAPISKIKSVLHSPEPESSPERQAGDLANLRPRTPDDDGDDDHDDDDDPPDSRCPEDGLGSRRQNKKGGYEDRYKEFQLVNPRNATITPFTGKNLYSNPYLVFNNQIRRLMISMGEDGVELLEILDEVEKMCNTRFTKERLSKLVQDFPKALEHDRAVKAALMNWTWEVAKGLVKHGIGGGMGAWRKL